MAGLIRVYTLNGLIPIPGVSTLLPGNWLGGQLFDQPFTRRDIRYQNWAPLLPFASAAANRVKTEARRPGKKIFLGHSEGAEILCLVLRNDPDFDPDDNVFVMTGNPERKYGGVLALPDGVRPSWAKPAYGGVGFPADTPFRVWDVARQYDKFADYPTSTAKAALDNIKDGGMFHLNYSGVRVGDPSNAKHVEGNVTYELQPSFPMPLCRKLFWSAKREALEDNKIRADVEKGYTRPFTVPQQTVARYSAGAGVDTITGQGVKPGRMPLWNPFA